MTFRHARSSSLRLRNLAWTTLLSAALAAPGAFASAPQPRWRATLEKDADETVGRWIEMQMLRRKLQRLTGAAAYGDPEAARRKQEIGVGEVFQTSAKPAASGLSVGAPVAGIVVAETVSRSDRSGEGFKYSFAGGSGASVLVSAASLSINVATGTSSGTVDESSGDPAAVGNYSFAQGPRRQSEAVRIEAANAALQAEFVAELKKTSLAISDRLIRVYGIAESSRARFEATIENRLFRGFRTQEKWVTGTQVSINVGAILEGMLSDARERVELLDQVVRAGALADRVPKTAAEARALYDGMIKECQESVAEIVAIGREHAESKDSRLESLLREFERFAARQEALTEELKLHQKFIQ